MIGNIASVVAFCQHLFDSKRKPKVKKFTMRFIEDRVESTLDCEGNGPACG